MLCSANRPIFLRPSTVVYWVARYFHYPFGNIVSYISFANICYIYYVHVHPADTILCKP